MRKTQLSLSVTGHAHVTTRPEKWLRGGKSANVYYLVTLAAEAADEPMSASPTVARSPRLFRTGPRAPHLPMRLAERATGSSQGRAKGRTPCVCWRPGAHLPSVSSQPPSAPGPSPPAARQQPQPLSTRSFFRSSFKSLQTLSTGPDVRVLARPPEIPGAGSSLASR